MATSTSLGTMRSETRELIEQTQHEVHTVITSGTRRGGSCCLQKDKTEVVLPPHASVLFRWLTRTQSVVRNVWYVPCCPSLLPVARWSHNREVEGRSQTRKWSLGLERWYPTQVMYDVWFQVRSPRYMVHVSWYMRPPGYMSLPSSPAHPLFILLSHTPAVPDSALAAASQAVPFGHNPRTPKKGHGHSRLSFCGEILRL